MRKEVKRISGVTLGITFTAEERRVYNIEEGDIIEIPNNFEIIKKKKTTKK